MKTIGVLTSGGDAPGMNAAVRAVVRTAIVNGINVKGVKRGYNGLLNCDIEDLSLRSVSDIINKGGTMLYTARCPEFKKEEGLQKAVKNCKQLGMDGIVVIGGDGSFRGARDLSERGIPCISIPGTIDNDIGCSEYTIGHDTAVNTVMEMVDRIRDTTEAHDRCSVVEVMGRSAGYLALNAGIAVGATSILIPEVPFDIGRDIFGRMLKAQEKEKKHFVVVVAEGISYPGEIHINGKTYPQKINNINDLSKFIQETMDVETRATVLGYVQRGGSPTVNDRLAASKMGNYAVKLLLNGQSNRVVVMQRSEIKDYDIHEGLKMTKSIDLNLYKIAHEISI